MIFDREIHEVITVVFVTSIVTLVMVISTWI